MDNLLLIRHRIVFAIIACLVATMLLPAVALSLAAAPHGGIDCNSGKAGGYMSYNDGTTSVLRYDDNDCAPVKDAKDTTEKYLKESGSDYKSGRCSLVKMNLDTLGSLASIDYQTAKDISDSANRARKNGDILQASKNDDVAGIFSNARNIYNSAKAAIQSFSNACKNGVMVAPFKDVDSGNKNIKAISYLQENGVVSGYPDGTFKPNNTVNRAELIKILVGGKGITPALDANKNCFPDVREEWFAPYVCYAKVQNWISGYPDGTFKPNQEVNKAEAIKMLIGSQGYNVPTNISSNIFEDVSPKDWFAPYIKAAKEKALLEETGNYFQPMNSMTRAGIGENIYRAMTYVPYEETPVGIWCSTYSIMNFTKDECERGYHGDIWIGMSSWLVHAERGAPDTSNTSNYGSGDVYQECWMKFNPSCIYYGDDHIVRSYN